MLALAAWSPGAQADNEWVLSSSTSGPWGTLTNWLIPMVPLSTDNVLIANSGTAVISSDTAVGLKLFVGGTSTSGGLRIDGGLLSLGSELVLGSGTGGVGAVTQTTGSVTATGMTLGRGSASAGTYDLSGGTLTLGGALVVGSDSNSRGLMTQTGGSVVTTSLSLGSGARSAGSYVLSGGTLTTSGSLSIAAVSGVNTSLTGTFTLSGGVLRNGSSVTIGSGSANVNVFAALVITDGTASLGTVGVRRNGRFSMTGGSGSANTFTISSGGTFGLTNASLDVQSLSMTGSAAASLASGTLISRGAVTTSGSFTHSGGTFGLTSLTIGTNSLYAISGGTIASSATETAAALSLSGTLRLDGSGSIAPLSRITISTSKALFDQSQSAIAVDDLAVNAGTYRISAGTLGIPNSWTLGTSGTMDFANGSAAVTVEPGAAVNLSQGTIANSGSASLTILGTTAFLIVPRGFDPETSFTSFSNEGTTFTVGSTLIVQNGRTIDLAGMVADPIDTAGTINLTDATTVAAGVTLNSSGLITGMGALTVEGAALRGTGTVATDVVVASGSVAPGFSPGTLTLGGNWTLDSSSLLSIEVFGTSAGQFDRLVVAGTTTLSGSLAVTLGAALPLGASLTIIDNQSSTPVLGGFGSTVAAPWAGDLYTFSIDQAAGTGNDMILTLTNISPVPEPAAVTIALAGLASIVMILRRR